MILLLIDLWRVNTAMATIESGSRNTDADAAERGSDGPRLPPPHA